MKEYRCGYEFPLGDSADHSAYHQSCCIRPIWKDYNLRENDDTRRCVCHARTDETKPTSALNSSDVREDDDNRAVNHLLEM